MVCVQTRTIDCDGCGWVTAASPDVGLFKQSLSNPTSATVSTQEVFGCASVGS